MKIWEIMKEENIGKVYKDNHGEKWSVYSETFGNTCYGLEDSFGEDISEQYYMSTILELDFEEVVDWSKVPVDTKILVSNFGTKQYKAYFAKYEDGKIYAWDSGRTSFTAGFENNMACWDYVKLYKEGEE